MIDFATLNEEQVDICFLEIIKFAEENLSSEDLKTFEETLDKVDKPQLAIAYLLEYLKRIPDFREKLNKRLSLSLATKV